MMMTTMMIMMMVMIMMIIIIVIIIMIMIIITTTIITVIIIILSSSSSPSSNQLKPATRQSKGMYGTHTMRPATETKVLQQNRQDSAGQLYLHSETAHQRCRAQVDLDRRSVQTDCMKTPDQASRKDALGRWLERHSHHCAHALHP